MEEPNNMALTSKERKKTTKTSISLSDMTSSPVGLESLQGNDVSQLVNELNLFQMELKHQDRDILKSQLSLDESTPHHTDHYDFVTVGYFTLSKSGLITEVNPSGAKLLGIDKHSLINRPFTQFMTEDAKSQFALLIKTTLSQASHQCCELNLLNHGRAFSANIICQTHVDIMTGEIQLLTFVQDISDRKERETLLQINRLKMANADRALTIGELASILVHEINQPLAAISNYLNGCIRRLESGNFQTADLVYALQQAIKQSQRTAEIMQGMKSCASKESFHFESACINSVIREAMTLAQLDTETLSVTYDLKPAENNPVVMLDKVHIQQAVFNLMKNALMTIKEMNVRQPKISVTLHQPNKNVVEVSLIYNGPLISSEKIYQLLHPEYSSEACSIALDIAVCRRIIEAHGGLLQIDSDETQGNSFTFTLSSQMLSASPAF